MGVGAGPGPPRLGEAAALAALGGFRIGVLTNGAQEIQEEKVRAIGLEELAGPVLTGEVLGGSYPESSAVLRPPGRG